MCFSFVYLYISLRKQEHYILTLLTKYFTKCISSILVCNEKVWNLRPVFLFFDQIRLYLNGEQST